MTRFHRSGTRKRFGSHLRVEPETLARSATPSPAATWAPAIIVLFGLAAYANTFTAPFIFDDHQAIVDNPTIRHLWPPDAILHPPGGGSGVEGRPLVNFSFALNHAWGGLAVAGYHAANLAIHLLAALTLFGIVRRTLSKRSDATPIALLASLLWVVHPLLTESVTCIVQRNESLMGLFYLLTLYCFVRYAEQTENESLAASATNKGNANPGSGSRKAFVVRFWATSSVLSCLLGMATKETMVTAPFLVLLYDRTFPAGTFAAAWRQRHRYYWALAATWLLLAFLVAREHGSRGMVAGFGLGLSPAAYALTQCWAIVRYLRLSFWPTPLILDYGPGATVPLASALGPALLLALLLAATVWALIRRPAIGFLAAAFFILLAPSSSILPLVSQTIAEHRMYLPLAALCVPAALSLQSGLKSRGLYAGLIIAALLVLLTRHRNFDYRSDLAIWSDTAAKRPENPRAQDNLGLALANAGRFSEAQGHYREALRLKPDFADVYNNLGNGLYGQGDLTGAIHAYREALQLSPGYADAWSNLGNAQLGQNDARDAAASYGRAVALQPDFAAARANLSNALAELGRPAEAVDQAQAAATLDPDNALVRYNLGHSLQSAGRPEEAADAYRAALRLDPGLAAAENNLGVILLGLGQRSDAAAHFRNALRLNPGYREACLNLGAAEASSAPPSP